jgi:hypothetical protein
MENWIERASEPRRLFLAWQAPDQFGDRFRWAVGIVTPRGNDYTFRYLAPGSEFESFNQNRQYEELHELGYQGYPTFNFKRLVHERDVLSVFMRRLPPRGRSDFQDYTKQFRLARNLRLSDFALLGRTEAKLPSDGFSMVDPLDPELDWCDLMLEIAGFRYYANEADVKNLTIGQAVEIVPEPENPKDPNALKFLSSGRKLGYVNRLQTKTFLRWLAERRISAVLERLNGGAEKPRAFVFVRVRPLQAKVAA